MISNLICGSRGSFICIILSLIFAYVFLDSLKKKLKTFLLIILGGLFIICLFPKILNIFSLIFPNVRTINLILQGQYFYLSGRGQYYHYILQKFFEAPFVFHGLYSDRIYLGKFFGRSDVDMIWGSYSHNFVLEVLFQFGIGGLIILLFIFIVIAHSIYLVKKRKDKYLQIIYSICASYCLGQLLVSGSYLTATSFGAYLGLLLSIYTNKIK